MSTYRVVSRFTAYNLDIFAKKSLFSISPVSRFPKSYKDLTVPWTMIIVTWIEFSEVVGLAYTDEGPR